MSELVWKYGVPMRTTGSSLIGSLSTSHYYYKRRDQFGSVYQTRRRKPKGIELLFDGQALVRFSDTWTQSLAYWSSGKQWYSRPSGELFSLPARSNGVAPDSNQMASRLHSKVKNQKVSLGQALAEYRQTASLFSDSAKRVAVAWRRLRRGDPVGMMNALGGSSKRKFSNNWLAFQYGVRPLVSDVLGSLELLEERRKSLIVFKVIINQHSQFSKSQTINVTNTGGITYPCRIDTIGMRKDRLTCYYTVNSDLVKNASSLGLTNPLSLAWEMVPYSFVVDWFVNVGDYLESIDTLYGVTRCRVYRGLSINESTRSSGHSSLGWQQRTSRWTDRSAAEVFPSIQLSYDPSLSWKRIVSGVALLRQSRSI